MIILLHSSKTMRGRSDALAESHVKVVQRPLLLDKAQKLATYLKTLTVTELQKIMRISPALAQKIQALIAAWTTEPESQSLALDTFLGDIYSGLQVPSFSAADRDYANQTLRILSGLYGIIRPYDAICPYRLEMGYKLPDPNFAHLYDYWGKSIAECLPSEGMVVNLASEEYAKAVTPYIDRSRIVEPKFLTVDPKNRNPKFVVVHAKIARGAFARWLIKKRVKDVLALSKFDDLGYLFDPTLSTLTTPTFVCEEFGGKGLSIRLK